MIFILIYKKLYLICVKRKGIVSFMAKLGSTSASKIAPVETGLQSLELFVGGLGEGSVLCKNSHVSLWLAIS